MRQGCGHHGAGLSPPSHVCRHKLEAPALAPRDILQLQGSLFRLGSLEGELSSSSQKRN